MSSLTVERITRDQIKLIHIAKKELGLSDDQYRALLLARYPGCFEGSSTELTKSEATDFIEHLIELGFKPRGDQRPRGKKQTWKKKERWDHESSIDGLRAEIEGYAKERFGESWLRPLEGLARQVCEIDRWTWVTDLHKLKNLKESLLKLQARGPYKVKR